MSDFNNSSAADETSHGGTNSGDPNMDAEWSQFVASHADEMKAIDTSSAVRRFEWEAAQRERQRHERNRREAQRQFDEMSRNERGKGPRDFETSILDDAPDDHFTPPQQPNANLSHYTRTYLALLAAGIVLAVLGFVLPRFAAVLEPTGGMLLLIGILALIMRRR